MIHDTDSALEWFKSSYSSGSEGDSCVEVAATPGTVTFPFTVADVVRRSVWP